MRISDRKICEEATLVILILTVTISSVMAQEHPITINKPKTTLLNPWEKPKPDHVRCFCNLPPCVSTGYMCKSSSGGCFSDVDPTSTSGYKIRHGCIEYLNEPDCLNNDKQEVVQENERAKHPKRLLVCCTNDLCNHLDNPLTTELFNRSIEGPENKDLRPHSEIYLYSDSEVWFRAATIAVPICGAVILFALIALAVKILKSENRNSLNHKLGPAMYAVPANQKDDKWSSTPYKPCTVKLPYYHPYPNAFRLARDEAQFNRHQLQMPLLSVTSETGPRVLSPVPVVGVSKNDTNAKINLLQCESNSSKSIILELGKSTPDYSLGVNLNSDDKFCKDDEKTFLS